MDDFGAWRCFNCGESGHLKADCPSLPASERNTSNVPPRAHSFEDHLDRIQAHVSDWHDGLIDMEQKRRRIIAENLSWHGPGAPRKLISV